MANPLNLKLKLNTSLKKQIEDEANQKKKVDTRFLNYYDLKDNEKVKILLIPDSQGRAWGKFRRHGPNLNLNGVGGVRCSYESSGSDCPACQKGFELLELSKQTGDESYKDEAKRWFARDYVLMSCLVLESPFEVQESPDGNQVKLIWLPYVVETLIKENIKEGVIDENELFRVPLFIKKGMNGKYANYKNSYFDRREVSDDELAFFEDMKVEQYDYGEIDVIPPPTTEAEVSEWLVKAIADDEAAKNGSAQGSKPQRTEPEPRRAAVTTQPTSDIDEDQEHMGEGKQEPVQTPAPSKPGSSLRDRLSNLNR